MEGIMIAGEEEVEDRAVTSVDIVYGGCRS